MSKIAIISQPNEGILIDVGGCTTLKEATHHLTSTLKISSDFWQGVQVDLSLGDLLLQPEEVDEILSIAADVGIKPKQVFSSQEATRAALTAHSVVVGLGEPMPGLAAEGIPAGLDESFPGNGCQAVSTEQNSQVQATRGDGITGGADVDRPSDKALPKVLCLRQTLRSGQSISHKGHLVIVGDVNPGAEVVADGDITVWGALRGVAHAGVTGNATAEIRALRLHPIQLRIAHAIARAPDQKEANSSKGRGPETARIVNGAISIIANNPD